MGTSGSTCTESVHSAALRCDIDGQSETLAAWHALHQGKAKQTILERHEYSTIRCMVCC